MKKATAATRVEHALYDTRINDRTIVRIVDDSTGELITRGTWYQDNVLSWFDASVMHDSFDYDENEYTIYIRIIEI